MIHKGKNRQQLHREGYTLGIRSSDCVGRFRGGLTGKNETIREPDCRYDKRGEESKEKIPEPVTRSRERPLFRSGAGGESLPNEDPDATELVS